MNERIKDCTLRIDSRVSDGEHEEKTSYTYTGRMMVDEENDCVKISYKEETEDGSLKNLMTIERTAVKVTKVGHMSANLILDLEGESSFSYNTQYGKMLIPVLTTALSVLKEVDEEERMVVHLSYDMPDAGTSTDMRISIALS